MKLLSLLLLLTVIFQSSGVTQTSINRSDFIGKWQVEFFGAKDSIGQDTIRETYKPMAAPCDSMGHFELTSDSLKRIGFPPECTWKRTRFSNCEWTFSEKTTTLKFFTEYSAVAYSAILSPDRNNLYLVQHGQYYHEDKKHSSLLLLKRMID